MLSFLQDTCDQISQETLHEACDWAVANPAIALGLTIGSAALAMGGLFWSSSRHTQTQPPMARTAQPRRVRESLLSTIESTTVNPSDLPSLSTDTATIEKMPVQIIVNAYMAQQREAHGNIGQTRLLAILFPRAPGQLSRQISTHEINNKVLTTLGLPIDGGIPTTEEGRMHYNQVLQDLKLDELKLDTNQKSVRCT